MGSFSVWHWLIVLVIVMLIFGTKKIRNIGADLGGAVRGFKDGMREGGDKAADGDAMRENSPRPSGRRGRAAGLQGKRPSPPSGCGRKSRHRAYDSAMTRAPANERGGGPFCSPMVLDLAISTYRCGRAPSRRRVPAATRTRATCSELP